MQLVSLASSSLVAVGAVDRVHIVDTYTGEVLRTLSTERMKSKSLRIASVCHGTPVSGAFGFSFLAISYLGEENGDCVKHVYNPPEDCEAFYFEVSKNNGLDKEFPCELAKESKTRIFRPGAWDILADGSILGMRRISTAGSKTLGTVNRGVRHRFVSRAANKDSLTDWEVWASSASTEAAVDEWRPLFAKGDEAGHLIISELGPRLRVGLRSLAFAFGNMIKVVSLGGPERFEEGINGKTYESMVNKSTRRKRQNQTAKTKPKC